MSYMEANGWTEHGGGRWTHASGRGEVERTGGGRHVAKLDGEALVGESGGIRYFAEAGGAAAAMADRLPACGPAKKPAEPVAKVSPTLENKLEHAPLRLVRKRVAVDSARQVREPISGDGWQVEFLPEGVLITAFGEKHDGHFVVRSGEALSPQTAGGHPKLYESRSAALRALGASASQVA